MTRFISCHRPCHQPHGFEASVRSIVVFLSLACSSLPSYLPPERSIIFCWPINCLWFWLTNFKCSVHVRGRAHGTNVFEKNARWTSVRWYELNGQLSDAASVHLLDGELSQRVRGWTERLSVYIDHIALKLFLINVRCVHTNIGSAFTSFWWEFNARNLTGFTFSFSFKFNLNSRR